MAPHGARSPSPPLLAALASRTAFVSSRRPTLVLNRLHTYRVKQRVPLDQPAPRPPPPRLRARRIRPGAPRRRGGQSRSPSLSFVRGASRRGIRLGGGGGPHPSSRFASAASPLLAAHAHEQLGPFIPHVCLSVSGYYYPCVLFPIFSKPNLLFEPRARKGTCWAPWTRSSHPAASSAG